MKLYKDRGMDCEGHSYWIRLLKSSLETLTSDFESRQCKADTTGLGFGDLEFTGWRRRVHQRS